MRWLLVVMAAGLLGGCAASSGGGGAFDGSGDAGAVDAAGQADAGHCVNCATKGLCTYVPGAKAVCQAQSDAQCRASQLCATDGACFSGTDANWYASCTVRLDADCAASTDSCGVLKFCKLWAGTCLSYSYVQKQCDPFCVAHPYINHCGAKDGVCGEL